MTQFSCEDEERTRFGSGMYTRRMNLQKRICFTLAGLWLLTGIVEDLKAQTISTFGHSIPIPNVHVNYAQRPLVPMLPRKSTSWEAVSYTNPALHQLPDAIDQGFGPSLVVDDQFLSGPGEFCNTCVSNERYLQLLPDGLLYKSYLAGEKEPRLRSVWLYERGRGWVWEPVVGGRVGLIRYGSSGAMKPEGWQIDVEGAAFPRIDPIEGSEMDSIDVRAGIVATWRFGPTAFKGGYYHISSHIGDEFLLRNPNFVRIEYVRDSSVFGLIHNLTPDFAVYGEIGYAFGAQGGAKPLEFQFGAEYTPAIANGLRGTPFAAVNGHLREDFNFGGNINVVAGWQWRGSESNRLFRAGFQYYNGKSLQYQFFDKHEELIGLGLWFDY